MATNPYERAARTTKASRIALAIASAHASVRMRTPAADVARRMTLGERAAIAAACGQRNPSDATWAEVVRLLDPVRAISDAETFAGTGAA